MRLHERRLQQIPRQVGSHRPYRQADARDLSRWDDCSFDAVLSLGPFYHLPDPLDRAQAARELTHGQPPPLCRSQSGYTLTAR